MDISIPKFTKSEFKRYQKARETRALELSDMTTVLVVQDLVNRAVSALQQEPFRKNYHTSYNSTASDERIQELLQVHGWSVKITRERDPDFNDGQRYVEFDFTTRLL